MLEELSKLMLKGYSVELVPMLKRMDLNSIRGFYTRYVWRVALHGVAHGCVWDGFETPEQCLEDLKNFVNTKLDIKE